MSEDRRREIRIQTARELEKRGLVDKAVAEFVKAGVPAEAARLLVSKERYADAGKLMLETLGVTPETAGTLEGGARAAAQKAMRCFELGGDLETAGRIAASLGLEPPAAPSSPPTAAPSVSMPAGPMVPSLAPGAPVSGSSGPPPRSSGAAPTARSSPPRSAPAAPTPGAAASPIPAVRSAPVAAPTSSGPSASTAPVRSGGSGTDGSQVGGDKWARAQGWRGGGDNSAQAAMIEQLLAQGKRSAAARVAWDSGRLEQAAELFASSGMDFETGAVLQDLGRREEALGALMRVKPDHKKHRVALTKIVDLATALGRFDFEIDRVLAPVAKAPPLEAAEVPVYLALAALYTQHEFAESARLVLEQILSFDAAHAGAQAALAALPPTVKKDKSGAPRRRERAPSAALPPLPSLEEFVAEAKKHAPPPPARPAPPRTSPPT